MGVFQFHHQYAPRLAHHERPVAGLLEVVLGAVENFAVDQLAAGQLRRVGGSHLHPTGRQTVPPLHDQHRCPQRLID